jgi:hypothetical protein
VSIRRDLTIKARGNYEAIDTLNTAVAALRRYETVDGDTVVIWVEAAVGDTNTLVYYLKGHAGSVPDLTSAAAADGLAPPGVPFKEQVSVISFWSSGDDVTVHVWQVEE